MNVYAVSHLAHDAGLSVHVVRDYMLRELLRPVERTAGGYGLFDADACSGRTVHTLPGRINRWSIFDRWQQGCKFFESWTDQAIELKP